MSALLFLLRRKLSSLRLKAYIQLGLEPGRADIVEKLYRVYLGIILGGWALAMTSWAVYTASNYLRQLKLSAGLVGSALFFILEIWLALIPVISARSRDLHKFEQADINFLSNTPLSPLLVAVGWFFRTLFSVPNGLIVLAGGILGSSVSNLANTNDFAGLGYGLLGSALFLVVVNGLRWTLHLLRYRIAGTYNPVTGYVLSAVGIALVFLFPWLQMQWLTAPVLTWDRVLFWPASMAVGILTGGIPAFIEQVPALAVLGLTAILSFILVVKVSKNTLLAPAFEEGRTGGLLRSAIKSGANYSEVNLQVQLNRKLEKNRFKKPQDSLPQTGQPGIFRAILYRYRLSLKRTPIGQISWQVLLKTGTGCGVALVLAGLLQNHAGLATVALPAYMGNLSLINLGSDGLRRELAHINIQAGWPADRQRLMTYWLGLGFALPLLAGELALLAGGLTGFFTINSVGAGLFLWPLLLAVSVSLTHWEFQRKVLKWAAQPETVPSPKNAILFASVAWIIILLMVQG